MFACSRIFIIFAALFLAACSTNKIVKTYEGAVLPEEAIAVLTAPENITLISVDGKDVQQYMLNNLKVNYGLQAGDNLVVFQFDSVWAKAQKDEITGSRSEVVQSLPMEVLIPAKAGERYTFSHAPANNIREARTLADSFIARVVDEQANLIAESVALNSHKQAQEMHVRNDESLLVQGRKDADQENELNQQQENGSTLEKLRLVWGEATPEEKKAFMVWVFQE